MNKTQLEQSLNEALPHLDGTLRVERVYFDKAANDALICLLCDKVAGERDFLTVKEKLRSLFPEMTIHVHIASPALGGEFLTHLDEYKDILRSFLKRQTPAAAAWLDDTGWSVSGENTLCLTCPDEFCCDFYRRNQYTEKLQKAVYDIFRVNVNVELAVAGERDKWLEAMRGMQPAAAPVKAAVPAKKDAPKPDKPKSDVLKGRAVSGDAVIPLSELTEESDVVVVEGTVFAVQDARELRGGERVLLTFSVYDDTDAVYCKIFYSYHQQYGGGWNRNDEDVPPATDEEKAAVNEQIKQIKPGMRVRVRGSCAADRFNQNELTITVRDLVKLPAPPVRTDKSEEKRIELHLHTNMSEMDALTPVDELIKRAAAWGHPAIAVTDHGCTQAYPAAFATAKKCGIKLIPGIEGYLCDLPDSVRDADDRPLNTPIVVLDFETTGLSFRLDRIIEVGAVRLMPDGTVSDTLSFLCNPGMPLRPRIIELTGITDAMLQGAETPASGVQKLLNFIGDDPVAAHNAPFDLGMLRAELARCGQSFDHPVLDTLTMARKLYPELKSHKLEAVCRHLKVSLKGAHRAVNDAAATAHCLSQMIDACKQRGAETIGDVNRVLTEETIGEHYHIVLLCKNRKGMQNLNHIISQSNLKYFNRRPNMPHKLISEYREGLIVGSACIAGELLQAMLNGQSEEEIERIASFYDYLEIQPIGNNHFMIREGTVTGEQELRELNRRVVRLAKKLGKPVVATGDVHFMDPGDAVYRAVIQAGQGYDDFDDQPPLYFKTTDEMLEEFSYLGAELAHEVVIDAPRQIADMVEENITLYPKHPEGKETFQPLWPEAANDIETRAWTRAKELYGDPLPEIVQKRLEKELGSIIGYGFGTLYSIAQKLVSKSLSDGYLVGSRGSVGSSFVATMNGITEVNPLPPHYRCDHCHKMFLTPPELASVGVDLPDANCEICGEPLKKDGYDIPFEVFLGFKGDKVPDIDLNFSGEYQGRAHAYIEELFGEGYVYRAGTISGLQDKTAFGYAAKYCERKGVPARRAQKERLAAGCTGVKRTTGQHPGGIVVLPKDYDICEFTAVQHPANDKDSPIITTHFDFRSMHDILVKLDCLGHDDPTMIHRMEALTGVPFQQIPLDDPDVISLFAKPDSLGVTAEEIECRTGTLGVPEFGTNFVIGMLCDTHPTSMEELIRISGLSHGTDVWLGNAQEIVNSGIGTLRQCFCTRDDIMNFLISKGVADKMSFDIMESVRKGKGLKPEMEQAMLDAGVPDWAITSCKKIKYMFPRGHAVAYVTNALRIAWYKVHYPLAYYAAYFSIRDVGFDASKHILPLEDMRRYLHDLLNAPEKGTARDAEEVDTCKMLLEMYCRGIRMLPLDLYHSDATRFLIEGDHLRCPFTSVSGFPLNAAQNIIDARENGEFTSVEDLRERAHLGDNVMEVLRTQGALNALPQSSQIDLLSLLGGSDGAMF